MGRVAGGDRRSGAFNRHKAILRTIRRVLMLMLAVLAVPLWIKAYNSPNLRVSDIVVEGSRVLYPAEIVALLPVHGESMFLVNPDELAAQVERLPAVKTASVHFRFPGQLLVRIQERRPRGVVRTADKAFYVDKTGLVIAPVRGDTKLVPVRYVAGPALTLGARLDPAVVTVPTQLDALLRGDVDLPGKVYEYAADSGVTVVSQTGLRVMFGDGEDLAYKVEAYRAILAAAKAQKRTVQLIDVRHGDRPYFR